MRLSWRQLIKSKLRGKSTFFSVGIAFSAESVLLCVLQKNGDNIDWVLDASFSHATWREQLANYVQSNKLANTDCYVTLTSHWYQLLQADQPKVEEDEMYASLAWPLKELLPSNTDYVYDYMTPPAQVAGQSKLNVVAIPKKDIRNIANGVYEAQLKMRNISIEETATIELTPPSDDAVMTLVQEHGEEIVLNVVKNGEMYFTRRLKGFENLGSFSEHELSMGITDSLCVQIQRSMDYFESQLRQPPVRKVLLKLDTNLTDSLANQIQENMNLPVVNFEPEINCGPEFNFKMASFSCLGAAYTKQAKVLLEATKKANTTKSEEVRT
ncbi:biogenesis protein MshI [Glaciecola sp. MH2013]|uniref:biogenesis protein MshI n=1 Tax=Glaciecola sp. MH2013 TaxID=2785524 RepID=UPI00189D5B10|nr:biogenesis protein MshI [Glaciecola sp. MH2013]MBF7073686.1 biogenesis protein MshI [Glaciecola sp. MH2013]